MKAIAETLGVSRSNLCERTQRTAAAPGRGRKPAPEDTLLIEIKSEIAAMPTYGYRRVHARIRRLHRERGLPPVNVKRVYRVMKANGLLLQRHSGKGEERRHDGKVAVGQSDLRWCSDGFEIGCDNGEKVRVAFTLDCCDREAIAHVATTGGITSEDIRDLMVESVERRFGKIDRLPGTIEWLSDNGSPYIAGETRSFARDIGLVPKTTPVRSPQSNGMAEAFVKTIKRDYAGVSVRCDAASVLGQLDEWFEHYNTIHPHKALGYRAPHEFRRDVMKETTEIAVGALRRSLPCHLSADARGSRPIAAEGGGAVRASLDARAAVDHL